MASLCGLTLLGGCGQKGNLTLPNDPDFKQRATLPDIIRRQFPDMPPPKPASPSPTPDNVPPSSSAPAPTSR